ncbi:acyltransferase [Paenibacillus sp. GYB003]|uniref:acyltransferase n=1 Tax=Paenibacillus sp. GYB003 TaxID=2994392 RepID=UPI002F96174E
MSKQRIAEIEIARGTAILCVLLIHGTSAALSDLSVDSPAHAFYFLVNRLSCFAVPAFVLYSGIVFFYRNFDGWNGRQLIPFYKRRIVSVLVPYIAWTCIYHYMNIGLGYGTEWASLREVALALATGSTMYHLYFAVLIMQYYILAPALLAFAAACKRGFYWLLGAAFAVQWGFGYWIAMRHPALDKSFLSSTYLVAFVCGCWIGRRYDAFERWLDKRANLLFAVVPIASAAFAALQLAERYTGFQPNRTLSEAIVHGFCIVTAVFLPYVWRKLQYVPVAAFLRYIGIYSFGIYLIHPAVMAVYDHYVHIPASSTWYHIGIALKIVVIACIPMLLIAAVQSFPWSWILFGALPRRKKVPERVSEATKPYAPGG